MVLSWEKDCLSSDRTQFTTWLPLAANEEDNQSTTCWNEPNQVKRRVGKIHSALIMASKHFAWHSSNKSPPPSLLSVAEIWASAGVGGSSLARYDLENWLHIVVGLTTPFLRSCPVCQSWGLREHGDVHFTSFISVLATDVEMFMTHLCNTEPGISKRSCLLSINFTILQVRKNMVLLTTKQNISSIMSCFFHSMCFHTIDERKH